MKPLGKAAGGNRTLDLLLTKESLYRLSHRGIRRFLSLPKEWVYSLVGRSPEC